MNQPTTLTRLLQSRIGTLLRLYVTLLLIFATQKVLFMLFNIGLSGGAPLWQCVLSVWHGWRLDSVTACYLAIVPAVVLIVSCFAPRINPRRILAPYYALVAAVMAIIFVADTVLYNFWGAKLDANDLIYAAKPKDMLASLPWWATLLGIVVIALVAVHYCRRLLHTTPKSLCPLPTLWPTLSALPIGALLFVGIRGGADTSTANPSYAYFSAHQFCNHAALNPTFNMLHSLFKAQNLSDEFAIYPQPEVDATFAQAFATDGAIADTLLSTPRPNVLLIVWESGGSHMVCNDSVGLNLMHYAQQGVYFSQCYANNFRTDRGLISIIAGWQGLPTTSLMKRTDLCRKLPSVARTLRQAGYATSMAYGGDIDFTNMRLYFTEAGFDSVRGSERYPTAWQTSKWGVPDHLLLTPQNLIPQQRPFFSAVLTLSSHEPWQVPMQRLADQRQNAFAYTDSCIGAMLGQLRTTPLWDSLLVVILPDHGVASQGIGSVSDPRCAHIPIVLTGGAISRPRQIDAFMAQSDLAATLLAQMQLPVADFAYSRNILSPTYPTQPHFAMHAYKNGLNLITPNGTARYDCIDRQLLSTTDTTHTPQQQQTFVEQLLQHIYTHTAQLATR